MAKIERLELRLDEDLVDRIDTWMSETGKASSRSDAVRQLLDIGLGTMSGKSIHLTDGDKLNFMMLRDIMKHLNIKDAQTDCDFVAEAIYGGHYWAPTWEMQDLFHQDVDRPAEVKLVVDTLEMWNFIERRLEKLTPEEAELVKAAKHGYLPKFTGFDGNHETTLMSIARFFVNDMNRFSHFKGREFNSHCRMALRYSRMTTAFEQIRTKLGYGAELSVDQIIDLTNI